MKVVATGYQTIPRERATGSFTQVDSGLLNQQTGTNILNRLASVAAGVSFDTKASGNAQRKLSFNIRGLSSINGPQDPLIVLDNFPYEGDINNINPNDVESITLLKDAAAASIWGARAGNGVVVIRTKKAKLNQKTALSFHSALISSEKPDLFSLPVMAPADYIDVEEMLFGKGYYNNIIDFQPYSALSPAVQVFLNRKNELISSADSAAQISALKQTDSRDDYLRYFYQRPLTKQYSLGISGGTAKNAYSFSGSYDRNTGETYGTYNKANFRLSNLYNPVKGLNIDLGLYYTRSESHSGRPAYNSIKVGTRSVPYLDFADSEGNALAVETEYSRAYTDRISQGKLADWSYYPLEDYKHSASENSLHDLTAGLGLRYKLFPWLEAEIRYQYERQTSSNETIQDAESYAARNIVNTFSQIDPVTGNVKYIVPQGGILSTTQSVLQSHNTRALINIDKRWGPHALTGIAGGEVRSAETSGQSAFNYGYQSNPLLVAYTDFVNSYPSLITGSNQKVPGGGSVTGKLNRFVSVFSNMAYTFRSRYILSLSARRDASNLFGLTTNDKWKPLWSAGLGWDISQEPFYRLPLLPYLKFRATYGYQGNADLTRSASTIITYAPNNTYTNFPQAMVKQLNNPELRWEKTGQFNIGADFSFSGNVISGSIDYYRKQGKDLYGPEAYDYTTWGLTNVITRNVASMSGRGVDITLASKNIDRLFKWNTQLFASYNKSKTTRYYGGEGYSGGIVGNGNAITPLEGMPLYAIASFRWAGLDGSGNPQGYLDGQLSTEYDKIIADLNSKGARSTSIVYHGPAIPVTTGSVINSFQYADFTLSVNLSWKSGYYFRKPSFSYDQLFSQGTGHPDFASRWQKPGDEAFTEIPSMTYPANSNRDQLYLYSEATVRKGDHVRLQYINCSYSFSGGILRRLSLKAFQLYGNAANLGILWRANNDGLDPDYPATLAPLKTFTLGLKANF